MVAYYLLCLVDRKIVMKDLDTAESKLDEAYKKLKLETEAKYVNK